MPDVFVVDDDVTVREVVARRDREGRVFALDAPLQGHNDRMDDGPAKTFRCAGDGWSPAEAGSCGKVVRVRHRLPRPCAAGDGA